MHENLCWRRLQPTDSPYKNLINARLHLTNPSWVIKLCVVLNPGHTIPAHILSCASVSVLLYPSNNITPKNNDPRIEFTCIQIASNAIKFGSVPPFAISHSLTLLPSYNMLLELRTKHSAAAAFRGKERKRVLTLLFPWGTTTTDGPTESEGGDPTPTTLARIEHAQQRTKRFHRGFDECTHVSR